MSADTPDTSKEVVERAISELAMQAGPCRGCMLEDPKAEHSWTCKHADTFRALSDRVEEAELRVRDLGAVFTQRDAAEARVAELEAALREHNAFHTLLEPSP